jgi:hypothetical protein
VRLPGLSALDAAIAALVLFALGIAVGLAVSALNRQVRRGPGRIGFHIGPVSKKEE